MSQSIEEQITEDLTQVLQTIRVNAGDNFNAVAEDAEHQGASALASHLTLRSGGSTPITSPLGRDSYRKVYHVECPISVSDASVTDSDERAAARIASDVVKAVLADYQRGALALNTRFRQTQIGMIDEQAGIYGAVVTFEVDFWTLKDNPFSQ